MATREIPEREWRAFFDSFSLQYKGWLVTVEILSPDIGAQVEARDLPLAGITVSEDARGGETVEIIIGGTVDKHLSHTITRPDHVAVKETEEGAVEALEIRSEGGMSTLVRFRSAMPVDMVDGLLES